MGWRPLFHITGLIAHVAVALLVPAELVPFYRFDPEVLVDVLREHRPTFTVAALPVYIALPRGAVLAQLPRRSCGCLLREVGLTGDLVPVRPSRQPLAVRRRPEVGGGGTQQQAAGRNLGGENR